MLKNIFIMFCFVFCSMFFVSDTCEFKEKYKTKAVKILYIDEKFDNYETLLIVKAADEWTKSSNNKVHFIIYPKSSSSDVINIITSDVETLFVERVAENSEFVVYMDTMLGGTLLGYYDNVSEVHRVLLVADRYETPNEMTTAAIHEFGHSLKLHHIPEILTIMYKAADGGGSCLTYFDLKQFCDIYNCDVDSTNYCMSFYKD